MKTFDCLELIRNVIGSVFPVGETLEDERRFESLKELCELHDKITFKIIAVAGSFESKAASVIKSQEFAKGYLQKLSDALEDALEESEAKDGHT